MEETREQIIKKVSRKIKINKVLFTTFGTIWQVLSVIIILPIALPAYLVTGILTGIQNCVKLIYTALWDMRKHQVSALKEIDDMFEEKIKNAEK